MTGQSCEYCSGLMVRHRTEGHAAFADRRFCSPKCASAAIVARSTERFWSSVDRTNECWMWTGPVCKDGYGKFTIRRRTIRAHRYAFEVTYGTVPTGSLVLHLCDVPGCVNPSHLYIGSPADNMADKVARGRCPRGASHGMAKLNEAQVLTIRAAVGAGHEIAKLFGVDRVTVNNIRSRRTWKHIP